MEKLYEYVCYAVIVVCSLILVHRGYEHYTNKQPTVKYHRQAEKVVAQVDTTAALVDKISKRYTKAPKELIHQVVVYSEMYAKPDFPRQKDILAMIAVESSFRPYAKSNLKRDPAIGLTQIRPGEWRHKIKREELRTVENQVKYGAEILAHNYKRLKDPEKALHAYNLGLTAAIRGDRNPSYVQKFHRELKVINNI